MLRIWGRLSSINVRKVVWAAQELGLAYQRTEAGGPFGIVNTPDYLRDNPNGLVPLIEDDGFRLWESNVIVRYLCANHSPGTLCPDSLQTRFNAERWMDWQQTSINPAGREAFIQWIRTPAEQRNHEAITRSVAATAPKLAMLERHLAQSPFVAGEYFTMGDIPLGCEIHRWWGLPHDNAARGTYPAIDGWYQRLLARPGTNGVLTLSLQ
jgi:glutathione S-transferase